MLPRSVVTLSDDGDLGIRAVDKDNKVVFFPIDLVDDTPNGPGAGGIPADARVIVAGQDLVTEGDEVNAGRGRRRRRSRSCIGEAAGGTQIADRHGYRQACDPQCAADAFGPAVPADRRGAGLSARCRRKPSRTSPIPIMYVSLIYQGISPEDAERLLLRPVETAAQEPQGAQGDEVGRLPGRRQRDGRVRSFGRSRRCADRYPQQGAGRQARPADGRRGADRQRGQPLRIPGGRSSRCPATSRNAR